MTVVILNIISILWGLSCIASGIYLRYKPQPQIFASALFLLYGIIVITITVLIWGGMV